MSRRGDKESSHAGTEAFRGAVVGTAKVKKFLQVYFRKSPLLIHFAIGFSTWDLLI